MTYKRWFLDPDGWRVHVVTERFHFPLPDGIIADVRAAAIGTHVHLTCGCVVLYVGGRWRGILTLCWNHEAQFRIRQAVAMNVDSAVLRN